MKVKVGLGRLTPERSMAVAGSVRGRVTAVCVAF